MRWRARIERLGALPGCEAGEALGLARAEGETPQPVLLRPVPEELRRDPTRLAQLERDLDRAGRLFHPNLAPPLGLGLADGPAYRVEGLVQGETLAAVIARGGRLPPAMAARVVADACAGVHFAHEEGRDPALVHGHLRPEVLLLCYSGATLVAGLGAGSVEAARPLGQRLPWMSPEQILVGPSAADRQTDVYLLGLVLHACLAGEPPFAGEADVERAALTAAPASLAALGVPAALAEVVERAVAKNASDRFPNAAALGRAVELALGELAPPGALAAYLDVLFPSGEGARAERLAMVEEALSRERRTEGAAPPPPPRPPPRPVDLVSTADILPEPSAPPLPPVPPDLVTTGDIVGDGSAPFMVARPSPPPPEPPRRDRGTAILAAGIAVAGLAIGYGLSQRAEAPPAPFPTGAAAPPAATPARPIAPPAQPAATASPAPAPPVVSPPPPPRARAEPRREAAASPPSIEVTADPPGDVYVDGKRVGRAPLVKAVSRGRHKVRLHDKVSGVDLTKRVEVKGPGTPVRFAVGKGALTVMAPEGAAILLDGRKVGTGRVEALPVYAGAHRLTVQLGPARNEHAFRIAAGETYSYDVQRTAP